MERCNARKRIVSRSLPLLLGCSIPIWNFAASDAASADAQFRNELQPILKQHCYACHGDGEKKGNVAFDSDTALKDQALWLKVLKNVRAGLMPPKEKPRLSLEERGRLENWIKYDAFGIDPLNLYPGSVTVHRLNRVEYRNTVR